MTWQRIQLASVLAVGLFTTGCMPVASGEVGDEGGRIGVQVTTEARSGLAIVAGVIENAPAIKAGIRPGDLILKVDDADMAGHQETVKAITRHKAGDKVKLTIQRDGLEQVIEITLVDVDDLNLGD